MWPNPQFPADLITFTEESLNEKLHFLYSESKAIYIIIFHFPKFTMIPAKNTQLYHSVAFVIFQLFVKIATVKLWQSPCDSLVNNLCEIWFQRLETNKFERLNDTKIAYQINRLAGFYKLNIGLISVK